jgi:tetratricopeptide (TPR) repeat protein
MGVILDELERSTEAINYVKKGLELEPANPDFWYIYGDILARTGWLEEAQVAYEQVIELQPLNQEIWLEYTSTLMEMGFIEEAIEVMQQAMEVHKKNADLAYRLAAYQYKGGHLKEAYITLEKALNMDFTKYEELFDYFPSLKENQTVLHLIDAYKKMNN